MQEEAVPPVWADRTVQLLREGYLFLPGLRWGHGTDAIPLRLLGQPAVAVYGPHGARLLYEEPGIVRHGAIPGRIEKTLFGEGGVQSLDGADHRHRKAMFMRVMHPDRLKLLGEITARTLDARVDKMSHLPRVVLMRAAEDILMQVAIAWTGVPVSESMISVRARQLALMVDSFAALGPRHWAGRLMRVQAERWVGSLVEKTRAGEIDPADESALSVVSHHRDLDGELLPARVAAVEILNIVRTLVAVGRYVAFTALALYEHGSAPRTDQDLERYVHEVRRHYPFVPFIGGKVDRQFEWHGVRFPERATVLLDIYGMLHDPRFWKDPQRFDPGRFASRTISPYDFVPQGGGDFHEHHRCAGEDATITVMIEFTRFLSQRVEYDVPPQDLTVDLGRILAKPASGFVISNVRPRQER